MILAATSDNIALAAKHLKSSDVIGMPTETVYGLAGCVFDEIALTKIFESKERPTFDPLIVHIAGEPSLSQLSDLGLVDLSKLSLLACERAEKLILRHPVARALIDAVGFPLAAPSANRFGRISPTRATDVDKELGDRVPLILDGGPCEIGLESTVLLVEPSGDLRLLRPGGISVQEIESLLGLTLTATPLSGPSASPGTLESHYAPKKPFYLLQGKLATLGLSGQLEFSFQLPSEIGLLLMSGDPVEAARRFQGLTGVKKVIARSLSVTGDLGEAGRNLFSMLRELDESTALILFSEPCTGTHGLGHAIADRVRRASHRDSKI